MTPDGELLRRYAEAGSEDAFSELVRRHLGLVYSAALRQVNGDAHLAQDVAQTVFADLARKAASLVARPILTGWLYTSTHHAAAKTVRTEQRRQTREQEAHTMQELLHEPPPDLDWERLRPVLDTAMHELNESEREVILMRYFENRQHADIGEQIGLSENAARMRVERALEKLRTVLSRRGLTTTAALSVVISANAVQAAPVGLAVAISTAAAMTGTTIAATATATAVNTIAMTTLQKTIVAASVAVLAGAGIYEAHQAAQLREEALTLRQQQALMAGQLQQLQDERHKMTNRMARTENSSSFTNDQSNELLRLRGEVGVLRRQVNEMGKVEEENRQLRAALHQMVLHSQQSIQESITPRGSFMPAGAISLQAAHIEQVLKIYGDIANVNIDADQEVRRQKVRFALTNTQALLTRSEAIRFLEQAFRDQAGVETTHPETNVAVFRVRR